MRSLLTSPIDILEAVPEAECIAAKNGDTISVHYAGTLEDGTEFDSSFNRNVPISFELGAGRVISGWEQGLVGCCIGEKRQLTIPPELGYGEYGIGPIPGGATLGMYHRKESRTITHLLTNSFRHRVG